MVSRATAHALACTRKAISALFLFHSFQTSVLQILCQKAHLTLNDGLWKNLD